MSAEIYNRAFYADSINVQRIGANAIMPLVFNRFGSDIQSVVDFGCGPGGWLVVAKRLGASRVVGLDGDWVPRKMRLLSEDEFVEVDLEKTVDVGTFDLALCLEVAEHLEPSRAKTLVGDVVSAARLVLWSAATPGQGGDHHVNEQPHDYWHRLFEERGFTILDMIRPALAQIEQKIPPQYLNNTFVYRRQ